MKWNVTMLVNCGFSFVLAGAILLAESGGVDPRDSRRRSHRNGWTQVSLPAWDPLGRVPRWDKDTTMKACTVGAFYVRALCDAVMESNIYAPRHPSIELLSRGTLRMSPSIPGTHQARSRVANPPVFLPRTLCHPHSPPRTRAHTLVPHRCLWESPKSFQVHQWSNNMSLQSRKVLPNSPVCVGLCLPASCDTITSRTPILHVCDDLWGIISFIFWGWRNSSRWLRAVTKGLPCLGGVQVKRPWIDFASAAH